MLFFNEGGEQEESFYIALMIKVPYSKCLPLRNIIEHK